MKTRTTVELNGEFREVMVEIPDKEPSAWPRDKAFSVLGRPFPRREAPEKVTGRAKYTYDINLPHMLWMKMLRSPYPHANVRSIDASRAAALPGVHLVLTSENTPEIPWHNGQSGLLGTTMHHVGDEVAAVVAETEAIARDAVGLLDVDYEELPFVLDAERALESDAPVLHEGGNDANGEPAIYSRGDVEQGFAEADFVVEESFRSPFQMHACLETHCAVVDWRGDEVTVWKSTQAVHPTREYLARALNIPVSKVRVICFNIGGGFGSKLWLNKHTVLAALAARQTRRPVKAVLEREEEAHSQGNRPGNSMVVKAGCKRDGTLTALSLKAHGAIGGYKSFWWGATCGSVFREVYKCRNVRTEEYEVYINADPSRPHRAPGNVQGTWAMEQVIDALAEA